LRTGLKRSWGAGKESYSHMGIGWPLLIPFSQVYYVILLGSSQKGVEKIEFLSVSFFLAK
jgi:hypothetical protein